ncbi:hypothetical protein AMTR_s00028p00194430 [Amborella trichopoda]|uniref:Uncharacterized protein n=1 Tax=Amborella trichopoda TaxID=13333 RepID=W1PRG8_AMBTC|nr:hypothetical protein AMTR_s00028p00194430 [Amborella trichopoda]
MTPSRPYSHVTPSRSPTYTHTAVTCRAPLSSNHTVVRLDHHLRAVRHPQSCGANSRTAVHHPQSCRANSHTVIRHPQPVPSPSSPPFASIIFLTCVTLNPAKLLFLLALISTISASPLLPPLFPHCCNTLLHHLCSHPSFSSSPLLASSATSLPPLPPTCSRLPLSLCHLRPTKLRPSPNLA